MSGLRVKVTLAVTLALLALLTAFGAFVYLQHDADLSRAVDRGLEARAADVRAAVQRSPEALAGDPSGALEADESVAQVLRPDGSVVAATSAVGFPLLDAAGLRRARAGAVFVDRPGDGRLDESTRLLAVPVTARGEQFVVVVGSSLDEKSEALQSLLLLEVVGLAAVLLVSGAVGYVVAGRALRPIERARAAEQAAVAKERRFIADASHELRTPLTILKSEIDLALTGRRSVAELESALRSTREETDRLCRLAEDLLVLAQADEGRLPIRAERLPLGDLLQQVVSREQLRPEAAGRRLSVRAAADLTVTGDRLHLEQALTNLVDNALVHGAGEVSVQASKSDGRVCIAVHDQGSGFPAGLTGQAFERFSRWGPRRGSGAGLGLSIVAVIAEAHGGSVEAGPGGRVRLLLPG